MKLRRPSSLTWQFPEGWSKSHAMPFRVRLNTIFGNLGGSASDVTVWNYG